MIAYLSTSRMISSPEESIRIQLRDPAPFFFGGSAGTTYPPSRLIISKHYNENYPKSFSILSRMYMCAMHKWLLLYRQRKTPKREEKIRVFRDKVYRITWLSLNFYVIGIDLDSGEVEKEAQKWIFLGIINVNLILGIFCPNFLLIHFHFSTTHSIKLIFLSIF